MSRAAVGGFSEMFGEMVRYRGLLTMLAWRDIRVRYKQSVLGIAWAFLMPLVQTLVLYAIFQFGVMRNGMNTDARALVDFGISMSIFIPVYTFYLVSNSGVHLSPMLGLIPLVLIVQLMLV